MQAAYALPANVERGKEGRVRQCAGSCEAALELVARYAKPIAKRLVAAEHLGRAAQNYRMRGLGHRTMVPPWSNHNRSNHDV